MSKMDVVLNTITLVKSCNDVCSKLYSSSTSNDGVRIDNDTVNKYLNGCYKLRSELSARKEYFAPDVYEEMVAVLDHNISRLTGILASVREVQGSFGSK